MHERRAASAVPPLVLAALGTWLLLRRSSLWFDELYTARIAPLPLAVLGRAVIDGVGPIDMLRDAPPSYNAPYYAVLHLWLGLPGIDADEVGLRSFSLVCAVGGVALLGRAVARLADGTTALVAGLAMALNPFVLEYAVEARGYGLALFAAGALLLALARWLDGARHGLVGLGVAAASAGLSHWFAVLVVAGAGVAALVLRGRRGLRAVGALAAGTLPAVGIVGLALTNGVGGSGAEWISGVGLDVPRRYLQSWSGRHALLLGATLALLLVGLTPLRRLRPAAVVGACWLAVPLLAVTALQLVRPVYVGRYLLPAGLGIAVLVAVGVRRLPRAASVVACSVLLAASAHAAATGSHRRPKDDVRTAVALLADLHRPGEPAVAAGRWESLGLAHYAAAHDRLHPDVRLHQRTAPAAPAVWVLRRTQEGVKGDVEARASLDASLAGSGLRVAEEHAFRGRFATTVVQRWVSAER